MATRRKSPEIELYVNGKGIAEWFNKVEVEYMILRSSLTDLEKSLHNIQTIADEHALEKKIHNVATTLATFGKNIEATISKIEARLGKLEGFQQQFE